VLELLGIAAPEQMTGRTLLLEDRANR
jgi:hypothetical protein